MTIWLSFTIPTGNQSQLKQQEDREKWVRAILGPCSQELANEGGRRGEVFPRTQTCIDAGLCCRHGGRGMEEVTGPEGLLGACSCQLCTNSPTSSVSFPAGK